MPCPQPKAGGQELPFCQNLNPVVETLDRERNGFWNDRKIVWTIGSLSWIKDVREALKEPLRIYIRTGQQVCKFSLGALGTSLGSITDLGNDIRSKLVSL